MDKKSPKYKLALNLINKILTNGDKKEITDLTEFVNIDREIIISEKNKEYFVKIEKELYKQFDKAESGWYRRKQVKNYILTFMRYMCSDIGLTLTYEQKDITTNINGSNYRKTHSFYSIK